MAAIYNLVKFGEWWSLAQLQQGHTKCKVQLLLGSNLDKNDSIKMNLVSF